LRVRPVPDAADHIHRRRSLAVPDDHPETDSHAQPSTVAGADSRADAHTDTVTDSAARAANAAAIAEPVAFSRRQPGGFVVTVSATDLRARVNR
jgi:hypothetical protein